MRTNKKKLIVFIIGTDRSGSTVLDMELGSYQGVFSVGEIHWIDRYLNENIRCMCDSLIKECPVWKNVINIPGIDFHLTRPLGWKNRISYIVNRLMQRDIDQYINYYEEIYSRLFETTDAEVLIDSTKDPTRAFLLSKSERFESRIVYLRRSLVDYLKSIKKSKQFGRIGKNKGILEGIIKWSGRNIECEYYRKKIRAKKIKINYSDLMNDESVRDFTKFVLQDNLKELIRNETPSYHLLGGNESKKLFKKFDITRP